MSEKKVIRPKFVQDARDLDVYKKGYELALDIHKASLNFPKIEQYALASQLRKASKSICANIAEGFGKQSYSKAEFSRFLAIAEGSAVETRTWLQFSYDLEYIAESDYRRWDDEILTIKSMIFNLRKKQ